MAASRKTIFITGTSSGIGLACAKLFYAKGWNVVATMRNLEAADPKLVNQAALNDDSSRPRLALQRLDVQSPGLIKTALEDAIKQFGTIDVLLNNAGYGQNGLFEAILPEQVQEQFAVNLFGVMDVTRAILPHFRANGGGGIINVSSGAGFWALPMSTMYSASKFALEGFTEALSYELASQNVFVKSIVPHGGVTSTDFLKRFIASTATDSTLTSYDTFVKDTVNSFRTMVAGASISSNDVAELVFKAATDGTDQLRYFIGDDARGFLKTRYKSTTDEEYMQRMRAYFK